MTPDKKEVGKVTIKELRREFERQYKKTMINNRANLKRAGAGYLDAYINDNFNQWLRCAMFLGAIKDQ